MLFILLKNHSMSLIIEKLKLHVGYSIIKELIVLRWK